MQKSVLRTNGVRWCRLCVELSVLRTHTCACGVSWDAPVTLSGSTPNLSSEPTPHCPSCGEAARHSTPWKPDRLAIWGESGPVVRENGRDVLSVESCGQISGELGEWFPECRPFLRYHLNELRPGCEHQRALGWGPGVTVTLSWGDGRRVYADSICAPCPTCGYRYGTQWLREELPSGVLSWFLDLELVSGDGAREEVSSAG